LQTQAIAINHEDALAEAPGWKKLILPRPRYHGLSAGREIRCHFGCRMTRLLGECHRPEKTQKAQSADRAVRCHSDLSQECWAQSLAES
jgi:hypothetical protein